MPRNQSISVHNSFARGFLTEATALTFPENACTDTDNCVFDRVGSVSRRLGFNVESSHQELTVDVSSKVIVNYLWDNVAGKGDITFSVVQIGDALRFYLVDSSTALSAGLHATAIDLTDYIPSGSSLTSVSSLECQFTSGNGLLFVTNPKLDAFYVTYDLDANTLVATKIDLMVRDFDGDVTDASVIDARPATNLAGLSAPHKYNLLNQGWTTTTLTAWDTARADMPSNCDVSWDFKNASDAFDFTLVDQRAVGNSPAPKGHFIYNAYNVNRSSNVATAVDTVVAEDRASTCAFYAGRVFYGGINNKVLSGKIFFSQIVQNKTQYGLCYQANDSTSETLFSLLATDGGIIQIPDAGTIYKLMPSLNALVIFASNGIWALTGSQGIGFTANDYTLSKISSIRTISSTSFVDVDGSPYWWNQDSIYTLTLDQQTNAMKVLSITDTTIKSFYNDILNDSKAFVRGAYDTFTKCIRWVYRSTVASTLEDKYAYDRVLSFSLISNAFYIWSIDTHNVQIHSVISIIGSGGLQINTNVHNSTDNVVDGANNVIIFQSLDTSADTVVKYFISWLDEFTKVSFGECFETSYKDWEFFNNFPSEYESYFVTGYKIKGQAMTRFQQNYVNVFFNAEQDTGFKIKGLWNFATTASSGDWTTSQTLEQSFTITAGDFAVQRKRVKIRGNGIACQFKVSNNGTKPFDILGWSVFETGNKWP